MSEVSYLKDAKADRLSKQTKRVRQSLAKAVSNAVYEQQDSIRGFALVTWDNTGEPTIAQFITPDSPIGGSMLPSYVHDQLQRYVNIRDAKNKTIGPI